MAFGEHMWRREKEHRFLETSRKDDHVKKAFRMCPCAPLLMYFLDTRFCYLHCNPF